VPLTPFHIAFPVDDLDAARVFPGVLLDCPEGRSSAQWIGFDLFGRAGNDVFLDPDEKALGAKALTDIGQHAAE
jgi:extradiol dioxygenase family protein